jgi:hypothetical protein
MSRQVARNAVTFITALFAVLMAVPNLAAASSPGDTTSPVGFINYLYQAYSDGDDTNLLPPESIYDPDLLALVKRDVSFASSKGGPPLLEEDPICLCQDYTHLQVTSTKFLYQDPDHAVIAVAFSDVGSRGAETLQLIRFGDRWMVHDILGGVAPSLKHYLTQGLVKEGALPTPAASAPAHPAPSLLVMRECEVNDCGLWWFKGTDGAGRWHDAMTGIISTSLTISWLGSKLTVQRHDLSSRFAAVYTGTRSGDKLQNTQVIWTFPNGTRILGKWTAQFLSATAEQARAQSDAAYARGDAFDAVNWLLIGADLGNAEMENDAGVAFRDGTGARQDYATARRLFLAAAQQSSPQADIDIAQLYERGLGVPVSEAIAEGWYEKAGATGLALLAEEQARAAEQRARAEQTALREQEVVAWFQALDQYETEKKQACERSPQCRQAMEQAAQAEEAEEEREANELYWDEEQYDSCARDYFTGDCEP